LKLPYTIPTSYQSTSNSGSSDANIVFNLLSDVTPVSNIEENSSYDISPADTITGLIG
jgi:hypothetical protein